MKTVSIEASEFSVVDGAYTYVGTARNAVVDEDTRDSIQYLIEECRPASLEDHCRLEFAISHYFKQMTFRVYLGSKPYAYRLLLDGDGIFYTQDVAVKRVDVQFADGKIVPAIICNGLAYSIVEVDVEGADIVFECCRLVNTLPVATTSHHGKINRKSPIVEVTASDDE